MALMYGSKDHQLPIRKSFENYVPHNFGLEKGSEESKLVAQKIKEFYYGDQEPSWETLAKFIEVSKTNTISCVSEYFRNVSAGD